MREVLARWVTHNTPYKLLSVVLALIAWLYVQGDEVADAKIRARLVWTLPAGATTTEQLPRSANVTVTATRATMRRVRNARVELPLDISGLPHGEHALELDALLVQGLPPGVTVSGVTPGSLRFVLDEEITRRVELVPRVVGDPAPGFRIQGITVDPPVIEVTGPRTTVSSLESVDTVPIDVSGMAADGIVEVRVDPPRALSLPRQLRVRAAIQVVPELERQVLSAVPVSVWRHHGWRPLEEMVEVTLEGPTAELRDLSSDQVVAFVHLPDRVDQSRYEASFGPEQGVRLRVLHPGGEEVKVVEVHPPTVTVVRQ